MKGKIKAVLDVFGVFAFMGVLGAVGSIERGTMRLIPGTVCALVCFSICGACVEIGEVIK